MTENSGISFGDNATVTGSALAAGAGARAHNTGARGEDPELARRVDRLIALLDAEVAAGRLEPDVAATGREVKNQLAAGKPNRVTVTGLLAGIAAGAGSLTAVTRAVGAVQELVGQLL